MDLPHVPAKSFLAYYSSEEEEGTLYNNEGEDVGRFFIRLVDNILFDTLIIYRCTPYDLTQILCIEN